MTVQIKGLLAAIFLLTIGISFTSCGEERSDRRDHSTEREATVRSVSTPDFNADSAFQFIADQLAFGPRVPGSEAHRACKDYLADQLRSFGANVEIQEFNARLFETQRSVRCFNVIGRFNPGNRNRIVLAAHWDSRYKADHDPDEANRDQPVPGADDGGSGVGVLLEVARQLGENPISLGVDIVFFDAEDQGQEGGRPETWGVGAQHWSNVIARGGSIRPQYGILLDMVGASNPRFGREQFSARFAPTVLDKVWRVAQNLGYGRYFINQPVAGVIDDHYFVNTIARVPMINIINRPPDTDTGFVPHWHTLSDDLDAIDVNTLRMVGHVVLEVIYREDAGIL